MIKTDLFLKQLEELINEYKQLRGKSEYNDLSDLNESVEMSTLMTKSVATIHRIAGEKSEYYKSIKLVYTEKSYYSNYGLILNNIIGIASALKSDIENGYLKSVSELIHSDLFSDYLEMASYLLSEGYKDPAAVIAGSTLESHMRRLCEKNSIEIEYENQKGKTVPKKADLLNADLVKADIYTRTYQKQIIAWLDLRNNAAHGKYDEYSNEEVKLMISGIMNFILTYSA